MYYVISITEDRGPERMCGPGTWQQCVQVGASMIEELFKISISANDFEFFEQDGVWVESKFGAGSVYIICCDPIE